MREGPVLALVMLGVLACGCGEPPRKTVTRESKPPETVRITQFYAATGEARAGEPVTVCYGVENARTVRLEPAVEELKPAANRCFSVTPASTTTYRLVAEGFEGTTASQSFTIKVKRAALRPAESMILLFSASSDQLKPGQATTLCYNVRGADAVSITPGPLPVKGTGAQCVVVTPKETTTYSLTAEGPRGKETRNFTITVK